MISRSTVQRAITIALLIGNLCLFLVCINGWTAPLVQSNKKTIIRRLSVYKYPVEISFELRGEPVKSIEAVLTEQGIRTEEFEADADWLKDLTLTLKNTSGKTITYVALNLSFPEVTKNGHVALHQVFLGVDPDRNFQRPELHFAPNQSLEIPLAARYKDIKTLVETVERIENVSKVAVEFHAALFDDGRLFETGVLFRRNPDPYDPRKWIRTDSP